MKQVIIILPGIKAVSRNDTTGHYFRYQKQLRKAEQWMLLFGKRLETHFEYPVDVSIDAYYKVNSRNKIADTPNIDDKIFTDILNRFKPRKKGPAIERGVWFIEDDSPKYLRTVIKRSLPGTEYKVVITIREVVDIKISS